MSLTLQQSTPLLFFSAELRSVAQFYLLMCSIWCGSASAGLDQPLNKTEFTNVFVLILCVEPK